MNNAITRITLLVLTNVFLLLQGNSATALPVNTGNSTTSASPAAPASPKANSGKPLEPAIRDAVRKLVNTSHAGLVEQQTGKGVVMKLHGRFRTAPVATVDANGNVSVRDYSSAPE